MFEILNNVSAYYVLTIIVIYTYVETFSIDIPKWDMWVNSILM
jgi:hypothetical protein